MARFGFGDRAFCRNLLRRLIAVTELFSRSPRRRRLGTELCWRVVGVAEFVSGALVQVWGSDQVRPWKLQPIPAH